MENSNKKAIAKLKQERSKAKAAPKRKENFRNQCVRFLIICEGTKTEPHYFKALIAKNTSTVREVTIEGEGRGTVALIDRTLEIKRELELRNHTKFDRVWAVFDKDDFNDFNAAIERAKTCKIHCAWTNESFELWYYLHFAYLDTAIHRKDYIEKLEEAFRKEMNDKNFKYQKGNPDIYALLQEHGDEKQAKKRAEKLRESYNDTNYATHKPCTMVDLLVEELEHPEHLLH